MKKFMNANAARKTKMVVLLVMMFFASSLACAQNEPKTAKPLVGVEVVRKVALLDIEGKYYQDVVMSFKPVAPDDFIASKYRVRIKVVDNTGKSIYKKTFRDVFLYVFSDGQVQVGKPNFNQIVIFKSKLTDTNDNIGVIREKEGIY
ncbi:hypothetical protein [uncultured Alistipes sp.]|uniref:hypothetical protein n=1 Tax=uncultured Alistipes sp. TaxID=538949 RepID=UPI002610C79F|nr:hypothetical protein [uncultured Alistipes sp.]